MFCFLSLTSPPHHLHHPWHHRWHRSSSPPSCPWFHSVVQTPSWSSESEAVSAAEILKHQTVNSGGLFCFNFCKWVCEISGQTDLSVHGCHGFCDSFHGLSHAVVRLERLDLQTDSLNICFHHDELLDITSCADQILRHDLNSILFRLIKYRKQLGSLLYNWFILFQMQLLSLCLTICPCLAIFLMSAMIFFSCCSSFVRSRSSSLMALLSALWFCLSISSGVFLLPNSISIYLGFKDIMFRNVFIEIFLIVKISHHC